MADAKVSAFTALAAAPAVGDLVPVIDISDTTQGAGGTAKKVTVAELFTSPTFVTPALGTPASGVATNLTGTAAGLTAGNVTTNANLTGPVTSVGNATAIADAALSIAKTSGLQAALDAKQASDADLTTLATAFSSASASGAASLAFHEDTDNGTNKITVVGVASVTADKTLTLPDATDTLVGKATTDTLTNKSVDLGTNTVTGTKAQFDTAVSDGNIMFDGDSIVNATATAHRVFYSDGSGVITELALGADGTFLKSNGAAVAPSFATPAGSGDVSKVGTPVNNQVGVWTGDGTLEGDAALTFDTATDTLTTGVLNVTGLTASEIVLTDASKNLVSAAVATYPSLTELTYVKGVTSAIQTQLGTKAPTASPTFTGTVTLPVGLTGVIRTDTGVVSVDSDVTDIVAAASTAAAGKVELATDAETNTGTDTARAITPSNLEAWTGSAQITTVGTLASPAMTTPNIGTPSAGTLTNCTGLPVNGIVDDTTSALGVGTIELGHASDTTLSRSAAGVLAVEGVVIPSISSTNTLTNKRLQKRVVVVTQSATPTINTDNGDIFQITGLAQAITSLTTNLSGTPVDGEMIELQITDNGTARAITPGSSFANGGLVSFPSTTVISTMLRILLQYQTTASLNKWVVIAVA